MCYLYNVQERGFCRLTGNFIRQSFSCCRSDESTFPGFPKG